MGALSDLLNGFVTALTPVNLAYACMGVILGTAIGVLPGIGPSMSVALLLPLTFGLDPTAAFILFAGIYYGSMYGGSTTSILLNTPGESSAVVTAIEGNLMAKRGRAAQARLTGVIAVAKPLSRSDHASIYNTPSSGPAGRPMPSPRAKTR